MENIGLNLKERLSKVFTCFHCFSKPEYLIFNTNLFQVLESIKLEALHIAEVIKINGLKLILKNSHNLFLGQAGKIKDNVLDFYKNLTYNIIFFCYYSVLNCQKSKNWSNNSWSNINCYTNIWFFFHHLFFKLCLGFTGNQPVFEFPLYKLKNLHILFFYYSR